MCDLDFDGDSWKAWSERVVAPRPEMVCDACRRPLLHTEPYYSLGYLYESRWTRERACFPCWWSLAAFGDAHGCYFAPSMLWEQLVCRRCGKVGERL
jgi:hypothetical protein